jgi:two-component system phosphate regulon sensor histidine kinase PhoR
MTVVNLSMLMLGQTLLFTLAILVATLALGMLLAAAILSRSIAELRAAADRFAQGDLSRRVSVSGPLQISALGESLNEMAAQLEDRLSTVVQQRSELGAVLSSMVEGVLAIDLDERILSLNRAAAKLLRLDPAQAIGRSIQETIRNAPLQAFVTHTLRESAATQAEFTLRVPDESGERTLQAQSAILRDAADQRIGAVIVLHDVTHIRRLERMRQEFVGNVSHEVRTPVSAVKAAVETLLSEEHPDPQTTARFLRIIARQADRLAMIVDDLLSLARIEQEQGRIFAELEPGPVRAVLIGAVETCQANADARQIGVSVECDQLVRAKINAPLLEQAMVNLIDNAIKYSPSHTRVIVSAAAHRDEVVLSVTDRGRGIEPEHLPRVFERFYRTDKARSRDMGGTGLGLSIVKHVAQAHGGRVTVESRPGEGSTFRIHLLPTSDRAPAPDPHAM